MTCFEVFKRVEGFNNEDMVCTLDEPRTCSSGFKLINAGLRKRQAGTSSQIW